MIERAGTSRGGRARGGEVIPGDFLAVVVPSGSIAQVPTEFTQGSRQPDVQRDIQALEAAVWVR